MTRDQLGAIWALIVISVVAYLHVRTLQDREANSATRWIWRAYERRYVRGVSVRPEVLMRFSIVAYVIVFCLVAYFGIVRTL